MSMRETESNRKLGGSFPVDEYWASNTNVPRIHRGDDPPPERCSDGKLKGSPYAWGRDDRDSRPYHHLMGRGSGP